MWHGSTAGRPRAALNPATRPIVIVAMFWVCTIACLAAGFGSKLTFVYPAAALALGWVLITRSPRQYVSFVWLLWFFTPWVRRVIDMTGGFNAFSPVVLAPPLTTALCALRLIRESHRWREPSIRPFLFVFAGVLYAFGRGVGSNGFFGPCYDLLEWVVPPTFAAYLFVCRRELAPMNRALLWTFAIGVLVMGAYGIVQFVSPLPWDVIWMRTVSMGGIGKPEAYGIRIFSTMNSPGPFALIMMAGLLLVPAGSGLFRWLALGPGAVSFLLSLVRSAWGGYAAGLLVVAAMATGKLRVRLIGILVVLTLVALPLLTIGPIGDTISSRMESLQSVKSDNSFLTRVELYANFAAITLFNPPGLGLGSTGTSTKLQSAKGELGAAANFDSGLLNVPYVLGWPGTLMYCGGIVALLSTVIRNKAIRGDMFLCSCFGIAAGAIGQMVFINTLIGVQGMVFWCFLGICLAGRPESVNRLPQPGPLPPADSHRTGTRRPLAGFGQ